MISFQAGNIDAIRSKLVVCVVKTADLRAKAFQIAFGGDGSLYITFPYFAYRVGLLSSTSIPATGTRESQVNLETGGKVASQDVKYSHHPSGVAVLSKTRKTISIKRQSIALDKQNGHMFSLLIQGVHALDVADPVRDAGVSPKRTVVDFQVEPTEAIKFVGRWFDVNELRFNNPTPTIGPTLLTMDAAGIHRMACLFATPRANARHVLSITCEKIAKLSPEPEMLLFYGGFDPAEMMTDPNKEAGFLAFRYPLPEADAVRERIGSADYIQYT